MRKSSKKNNILIVSDIPPCKNYSGGIMNNYMIKFLLEEKQNISYFCCMNNQLQPEFDDYIVDNINLYITSRPSEDTEGRKKYSKIMKRIFVLFDNFLISKEFDKVLFIIQGKCIIDLIEHYSKKTKKDYYVQIWDPIDWWLKDNKYTIHESRKVLERYNSAIKNSKCCITSSFAMSKLYKEKYNIKCCEFVPTIEQYTEPSIKSKNQYIIGFAGQMYAKEEFNKLISALSKMNWKIENKNIVLNFYGSWSTDYLNDDLKENSKHIINKGYLNQRDLQSELNNLNLLYCPYFFSGDEDKITVSKLSFPSKLVTYFSVKTPVLIHAPEYSSPYIFAKENSCAYLINTLNEEKIKIELINIVTDSNKNINKIINNAKNAIDTYFSKKVVKKALMNALDIEYNNKAKKFILEVNNVDLPGKRFNGYDLQEMINNTTDDTCKQIVTYKTSTSENVTTFYKNKETILLENTLNTSENSILSVHNQLALSGNTLLNNDYFKNADVVHYHLVHNTKFSIYELLKLCNGKKSILTFHDPWYFTGHCVYPQECKKWKNGCKKCSNLETLFSIPKDNCASLWKLKQKVFDNLNADIVVSTPFMMDMVKCSPITRNVKNVHFIPFGIDLEFFKKRLDKNNARKELGIPQNDIVFFFRAQMAMKGTEFILEAMKLLKTDKKITLLSCDGVGLMDEVKDKFNVIDLGHIEDDIMIKAYNAADIFLMPSRSESFGLMAIEAMACELPVVIFDNSALPGVTFAPDCGVLVENKNSRNLMEKIKWLIENPDEIERRGKLGRKLAEENYDINTYHDRILKLYEEVYNRELNPITINKTAEKDENQLNYLKYLLNEISLILVDKEYFPDVPDIDSCFIDIDFSNDYVQELIELFNINLYQELNNINDYSDIYHMIEFYTLKEQFKLLKNNRNAYVKYIENNNKLMYFIYRGLRKIYRLIFSKNKKNYINLEKRITNLEKVVEILYERNKVLEIKNKDLEKKIKKQNQN